MVAPVELSVGTLSAVCCQLRAKIIVGCNPGDLPRCVFRAKRAEVDSRFPADLAIDRRV
jgi:hypothetical protein